MTEGDTDLRLLPAQQILNALLANFPVTPTMTESLRPQHFITRQNGTMVPLVALDELPATVSLRGVPRTLSPYDVGGMTGLGTVDSQHRQYVVDRPRQGFQPEQKVVENGLLASKYANIATNSDLESSFGTLDMRSSATSSPTRASHSKAYGIKETRSALPSNLRNDSIRSTESATRPLTIEDLARSPAPGVKEYCSYWLRHGECDYAQQGCLYRHEMPLDPPTLEKLGLRDIPRWYREKHGLGSYLALTAQRAASTSTRPGPMERNWRKQPVAATTPSTTTTSTTTTPKSSTTIRPTNTPPHPLPNSVTSWNMFAQNHTTTTPPSHLLSPPPTPPHQTPPPRLGTRLVPTTAETASARILREANEQLDACDERDRAALTKYAPLVPLVVCTESARGGDDGINAAVMGPALAPAAAATGTASGAASATAPAPLSSDIPMASAPAPLQPHHRLAPAQKNASLGGGGSGSGTGNWSGNKGRRAKARPRRTGPVPTNAVTLVSTTKNTVGSAGGAGGASAPATANAAAANPPAVRALVTHAKTPAATGNVDRAAQREAVARARVQALGLVGAV